MFRSIDGKWVVYRKSKIFMLVKIFWYATGGYFMQTRVQQNYEDFFELHR